MDNTSLHKRIERKIKIKTIKALKLKSLKENITAWILLIPALSFLILFTFYPIIKTIKLSFYKISLGLPEPIYNGIQNYHDLLSDDTFWRVMKNTGIFVLGTVIFSMILALIMALFVNEKIKGMKWLRASFFYPAVIPGIAVANIWLFIYTPQFGLLDNFLKFFGINNLNLLGNTETVLWATIVMTIWKQAGFYMIFYLSGLQNISQDLYEAASIDGASSWCIFKKITFPLLMPTNTFVFIIATIRSFKLVDHLVIMTQGGPDNASNLLLFYIYEVAFKFWNEGKAATLTVIMLIILLIISSIQFFVLEKRTYYR